MYYCHSRYYVPEWCRWLNADSPNFLQPESLNGMNLFSYCGNDPVNRCDTSGRFWKSIVNNISNWFNKTVGFATNIVNDFGSRNQDRVIYREVDGAELETDINKGDYNKPITFFLQFTKNLFNFTEYEIGISINGDKGGVEISLSLAGGINVTVNNDNTSYGATMGVIETGLEIGTNADFKNKTAEAYHAWYFRPIVAYAVVEAVACVVKAVSTVAAVFAF